MAWHGSCMVLCSATLYTILQQSVYKSYPHVIHRLRVRIDEAPSECISDYWSAPL